MSNLHIPDDINELDPLTAALAYASAGWYVLPVRTGTKHPGSVVGDSWPALSSRDPKTIAGWFAGTSHGIALHCGRSGAVVLDVDDPDNIPDEVAAAIREGVAAKLADALGLTINDMLAEREPTASTPALDAREMLTESIRLQQTALNQLADQREDT